MKNLCNILEIIVNELLSGELIDKVNYDEIIEITLLKQKEYYDKKLLRIEILVGIIVILPLIISIIIVSFISFDEWISSIIVGTSIISLLLVTSFVLMIEQIA